MAENINLPGVAASDFNLARERYYAGIRAGYTPEQADEMYLAPMRLKWQTLAAASPRTTQSISGSFEPVAAEDVAQMDTALSNFYRGVKAGYDPKDAVAQYIAPVASGVMAAGWARQEQDRANMSDALKEQRHQKFMEDYFTNNANERAVRALAEGVDPGEIARAADRYTDPSLVMRLSEMERTAKAKQEQAAEKEAKATAYDPWKNWQRIRMLANDARLMLDNPIVTAGGQFTPEVQSAYEAAKATLFPQNQPVPVERVLLPSDAPVLTNAVPKFRVIGVRQVQ